jgi:hypothetical protein
MVFTKRCKSRCTFTAAFLTYGAARINTTFIQNRIQENNGSAMQAFGY